MPHSLSLSSLAGVRIHWQTMDIELNKEIRKGSSSGCHAPIFLFGILPRSGTNFVNDLLRLHPDCTHSIEDGPRPDEDFVLHLADPLLAYARALGARYGDTAHATAAETEAQVKEHVGRGVVSFLRTFHHSRRMIVKAPSVRNLGRFFELFPDAKLLILVRDGRSVIESGLRSFRAWNFEAALHWWSKAAREVQAFDEKRRANGTDYLIVRYEDLVSDFQQEMRRILAYLELDIESFDFHAAANLPVRGSSVERGAKQRLNWGQVDKSADFDPMQRWHTWSRAKHERFNWVAGSEMTRFGYTLATFEGGRVWNTLRNTASDCLYRISWLVRGSMHRVFGRLYQRSLARKRRDRDAFFR